MLMIDNMFNITGNTKNPNPVNLLINIINKK